jgi:hypothetical protein
MSMYCVMGVPFVVVGGSAAAGAATAGHSGPLAALKFLNPLNHATPFLFFKLAENGADFQEMRANSGVLADRFRDTSPEVWTQAYDSGLSESSVNRYRQKFGKVHGVTDLVRRKIVELGMNPYMLADAENATIAYQTYKAMGMSPREAALAVSEHIGNTQPPSNAADETQAYRNFLRPAWWLLPFQGGPAQVAGIINRDIRLAYLHRKNPALRRQAARNLAFTLVGVTGQLAISGLFSYLIISALTRNKDDEDKERRKMGAWLRSLGDAVSLARPELGLLTDWTAKTVERGSLKLADAGPLAKTVAAMTALMGNAYTAVTSDEEMTDAQMDSVMYSLRTVSGLLVPLEGMIQNYEALVGPESED